MKSMKKVLALGLALAMAVTAVPVTSAQAATVNLKAGKTVNKTYYAGSSHTLKLSGVKAANVKTKTWKSGKPAVVKVSNATKTSAKISCLKKGNSTVTATLKMKNGKTKKFTCKVTVKAAVINIAEKDVKVLVGGTQALAVTTKPAGAAVTFASSNEDVATVDAKGVITGKAAGEAVITASLKSAADVTVNVKVVQAQLESVKQTKLDTIVAQFAGDASKVATDDITVSYESNGAAIAANVKKVEVKDNVATISMYTNMTSKVDAPVTYTVAYGDDKQTFVASTGVVASVDLVKTEVVVNTEANLKSVTKDADGVEIETADLGASGYVTYDINVTDGKGYATGNGVFLSEIGATAVVDLTYHSNKYDTTTGEEIGNIENKGIVVTAVAAPTITSWAGIAGKDGENYSNAKAATVAVGDTDKKLFIQYTLSDGTSSHDLTGYILESSNSEKLVLGTDILANGSVELKPVAQGTAFVVIKNTDGNTVGSVAVTISAARYAASLTTDKATAIISNALPEGVDSFNVAVTLKDQYGDDFVKSGLECNLKTDVKDKTAPNVTDTLTTDGKLVIDASNHATAGSYQYEIKCGSLSRTVSVTVQAVPDSGTEAAASLELSSYKGDAKIALDATANTTITGYVFMKKNGVKSGVVTGGAITAVLKDSKNVEVPTSVISGSAVAVSSQGDTTNAACGKITVSLNNIAYGKKLAAGKYTLEVTVAGVKNKFTKQIEVTDSQPVATAERIAESVSDITSDTSVLAAFKFTYNGDEIKNGIGNWIITLDKVVGTKSTFVKTATIRYSNNGVVVQQTITVGKSVSLQ